MSMVRLHFQKPDMIGHTCACKNSYQLMNTILFYLKLEVGIWARAPKKLDLGPILTRIGPIRSDPHKDRYYKVWSQNWPRPREEEPALP